MEQKQQFKPPVDVSGTSKFSAWKASFMKKPPKQRLLIVLGIGAGAIIAFLIILSLFGFSAAEPEPAPDVVSNYVPPATKPAPLTGVEVANELADRPVTAVMIENSIEARPQSGLEQAGMVFEAIAEGGITRFMAVYQEARPGNIGPIRSARPYYVEWAKGLDASYLHSGGSGEALALIQSLGVKDLDHGKLGTRIADRVSNRFAPHNVYSNFDKIDSVNNELGYTSSTFTPFERKEASPSTAESPATASSIVFNISSANYNTSYTYDAAANDYKRVMAGLPHSDQETGAQISPEVVVALVTDYGIHPNGIHSQYRTTGSGQAIIFQDGKVVDATWRKANQSSSLELLDANNAPVELNPGQTWITAIQAGRVSYTP